MATSPTPIAALPTPPSTSSPSTFDALADGFIGALPVFRAETNAVAVTTYDNAVGAAASASTATTQAGTATTQAGLAATAKTAAETARDAAAAYAASLPSGSINDSVTDSANTWSSTKISTQIATGGTAGVNSQSSNYTILSSDKGKIVSLTGATSSTFTTPAAATVGAGWYCYVKNAGNDTTSGTNPVTLTIDGNSSETVDGVATVTEYTGGALLLSSDGTNWTTIRVSAGFARFTQTGTLTFPTKASGWRVEAYGPGGNGGAANRTTSGGGGGGGGAMMPRQFVAGLAVNTSVTATVATGGSAGSTQLGSSEPYYARAFGGANGSVAVPGGGGGWESAGSAYNGGAPNADVGTHYSGSGRQRMGLVSTYSIASNVGGGGGGGAADGNAEYGGGGGESGGSVYGGGGGGNHGARGGGFGSYAGNGGGAAGSYGVSSNGGNGTAGTSRTWGAGDGGGGGGNTTWAGKSYVGGNGGGGGIPSGGGGGAGAGGEFGSEGTFGAGGRGEIRVWYW